VAGRAGGRESHGGAARFLEKRLKLKVNGEKSAATPAHERDFLSFRILGGEKTKRGTSKKARKRFRRRIKEITRRTRGGIEILVFLKLLDFDHPPHAGVSLERGTADLNACLRGWMGCFGFRQTPSVLRGLDSWITRRLRCCIRKRLKLGKRRYKELRAGNIDRNLSARTSGSVHGPWRISRSPALSCAFPNAFLAGLGLIYLEARCSA